MNLHPKGHVRDLLKNIKNMVLSTPSLGDHNGTKQDKTRCVIHNGPTINLISTIDIYDKLIIVKEFFKKSTLMYSMLL